MANFENNLDAYNEVETALGGSGLELNDMAAVRAIAVLEGVSGGPADVRDDNMVLRLNAIDVGAGGPGAHENTLDALNSIVVLKGGVGGHENDLDAINEWVDFADATLGLLQFIIHAYRFEEAAGGPYLDSVGAKNLTGTNAPGQVAGIQGNAIDCDDVAQSFASASAITNIGTTFSVEVWINADDLSHAAASDGAGFLKNMEATNGIDQDFRLNVLPDGSLQCWVFNNTNNTANRVNITASGLITTGAGWQQVVLTFTALTMTLYIDGTVRALSDGAAPSSGWGAEFAVGRQFTAAAYYWDGGIDEVRIYNSHLLTAAEVLSLWNGGAGVPFSGL